MNSISPHDLLIALFYQENDTVKILSTKNSNCQTSALLDQLDNHSHTLENKMLTELLASLEHQDDIPVPILESLAIMLNFLSDLDTLSATESSSKEL